MRVCIVKLPPTPPQGKKKALNVAKSTWLLVHPLLFGSILLTSTSLLPERDWRLGDKQCLLFIACILVSLFVWMANRRKSQQHPVGSAYTRFMQHRVANLHSTQCFCCEYSDRIRRRSTWILKRNSCFLRLSMLIPWIDDSNVFREN